jgi:hypothetical protein
VRAGNLTWGRGKNHRIINEFQLTSSFSFIEVNSLIRADIINMERSRNYSDHEFSGFGRLGRDEWTNGKGEPRKSLITCDEMALRSWDIRVGIIYLLS